MGLTIWAFALTSEYSIGSHSFAIFRVLSLPVIEIENLVVFLLESGLVKLILLSFKYCFGKSAPYFVKRSTSNFNSRAISPQ